MERDDLAGRALVISWRCGVRLGACAFISALVALSGGFAPTVEAATDLGTLTPPGTYPTPPTGVANGINDSGVVVGEADNEDANGNVNSQAVAWRPPATPGGAYTAIDLGGTESTANAVNSAGQIAGWNSVPGPNPTNPAPTQLAVVWTPAGAGYVQTYLDVNVNGITPITSQAFALNAGGQVVGTYQTIRPGVGSHAVVWTPSQFAGSYLPTDLPVASGDNSTPGQSQSQATAITSSGLIAGWTQTTSGVTAVVWTPTPGALGGYSETQLSDLYGHGARANAIDDTGDVMGQVYTNSQLVSHAALWKPAHQGGGYSAPVDLGTLGGTGARAFGINHDGLIVGDSSLAGDTASHAAMWRPSGTTGSYVVSDLGTLGGPRSSASAINTAGQIAGWAEHDAGVTHPTVWSPTFVVSGFPASAPAGTSADVTVVAQDAAGNTLPSYTGPVHVTSSDPRAILPLDMPLVGGRGTFAVTLRSAGAQSITVSDAALPSIYGSQAVAVTPAAIVSGMTPRQGSVNGGTIVTLTGSRMSGATSVSFGSAAATAFTVIDDSTIQATAPSGTPGPVDVTVTTPPGPSAITAADHFTYVVPSAGSYQGMQPSRICDTRKAQTGIVVNQCNNGGNGASLGPGQTMDVQVCGAFGGPSACTLGAVTMNVTVTGASAPSYLTVYPTGSSRPVASTLNFTTGDTRANLATLKVGSNGQVTVFNYQGTVDVVIDLEGTAPASGALSSTAPGLFHPLTSARVCDTRANQTGVVSTNQCNANGAGAPLGAAAAMSVQMTGQGGIPASGVSAVVFNLTVTNTTAASYMTAWPAANTQPLASNLNWAQGQTVPNRVVVPMGHNGQVSLFNSAGRTDVVVDVGGWYGDGTEGSPAGATFTGVVPSRICDTRPQSPPNIVVNQCDNGGQGAALGANQSMTVQVTGTGQPVPAGAVAVVANVTVTNTTAASYLTVWPSGANQPGSSDLNWTAGQTAPNLVVVALSSGGAISLYNHAGSTEVIVDVMGYLS